MTNETRPAPVTIPRKAESALPPAQPISVERLYRLVRESKRVLLLAGQPIDGDSLASALALRRIIQHLGIEADVACGARVPRGLEFLDGSQTVLLQPDFLRYDLIIILDCGELKQTGFLEQLVRVIQSRDLARVVNVDHHLQQPAYGHYCLIDHSVSATGVLVYRMLTTWQNLGLPAHPSGSLELLDLPTAEALLTTLYNDTGSFQHSNTTAEALRMAAACVRAGADASHVAHKLYRDKPRKVLNLWGRALERLELHPESNMSVSFITHEDLQELGVEPEEAKGIVSVLSYVPESKFALLLSEDGPNIVKGSLRSDEGKGMDVSRIARVLGGGGHRLASGFKLTGRLERQGKTYRVV
ncbi:MAG: DHH family phosphoesterase [Candidatus Andersenbacteria bacterium]